MNDISHLRRQIYMLLIVGAVAVVSGRILHLGVKFRNVEQSPMHSSNDRSRWATARALVDHHTYAIGQRTYETDQRVPDGTEVKEEGKFDDYGIITEDGWKTVDRVLDPEPAPGKDGKVKYFYSSKPPFFSTLVAGEYWLLKQFGLSIITDLPWVVRIILLTFNVLPLALYLYLLGRLADQFGASDWGRLFLVFAAGFATFVTSFGHTLNNHTVATCLALFGLAAFLRIWRTAPVEAPAAVAEPKARPAPPPAAAEKQAEAPPPTPPESEKPLPDMAISQTAENPPASAEKPAETRETVAPAAAKEQEGEKEEESEEGEEAEAEAEAFTSFRTSESSSKPEAGPASSSSLPPVRPAGGGWYFLAGLCSGLAAAFELPALAFTAIVFALLWRRDWKRTLKFFLPPAVLVVAAFFVTNYLAIGRLVPVQALGVDSPWYQYERSHWRQDKPKTGIDFADEDKLTYACHFLIGHHGVFALSPIFLLSLAGMAAIFWRGRQADRGLLALAGITACLTVLVIGFYIYKTNNYGGFSSGPRWLMWLTPFWLLTLLPMADKLASCRWGRTLALLLLGISVLSASFPAWNPWQHPWIYNYVETLWPELKY